jgi:hypothetical protein
MEGELENMFRCKKASWQVDLGSGRRKFVFCLVAMEILFLQENTEIRGFLLSLEKLEALEMFLSRSILVHACVGVRCLRNTG